MAQATLMDSAVREFKSGLKGPVLQPGDGEYDAARAVFNGMIDRRPALIARCRTVDDVVAAVNFARRYDLLVAVRGGGHAVTGHAVCDDGLMIDMSLMKGIEVDPGARTALAETGLTWGEFDAATQQHGLAVTGGRVPSTGIAGLTLGSGSGWLERRLGYTVDSVVGAEVVTADGRVVRANATENPDLFWGLRGGSGNFGIVTKLEYRLHEIGPIVYGGMLLFTRERAAEITRRYRDFMEGAPDEVGGALALLTAPPEPFVPEELRGKPAVGCVVCYTGDPADGERVMRPILDLKPVVALVQPMPYLAVQGLLVAGNPHGMRNYWKADMYPELPDAAIDALIAAAAEPPSPLTTIIVQPLGGAISRVDDDAMALGWRRAKWALHVLGMWAGAAEDESQIGWVCNVAEALKPYAQAGVYLNYIMDEGEQRVHDSYGRNYDRMAALKNKYDPTNFFRLNQNIKPTTNGARSS